MSQILQVLRTNAEPSSYTLLPGEFGLKGRILSIGPKTDDKTPGSEQRVAPMRILTEDDIASLNAVVENYKTEMSQIAAGKNKAYVVADQAKIDTAGKKITLTDGKVVAFANLAVGDYVWVVATNTPDYWWDGTKMQAIEVDHPDLSGYMLTATADGKYQTKAAMTAYLTTSAASSTYVTKTAYDAKVSELQSGLNNKLDRSGLVSIISAESGGYDYIPWATGFRGETYLNQWTTGTQPSQSELSAATDIYSTLYLYWRVRKDLTALINACIFKTSIANNLTTNDATQVLAASQGKILLDKVESKVSTSDIVNSLANTATNRPLAAAQGKILNDSITALRNDVNDLITNIDGGIWA